MLRFYMLRLLKDYLGHAILIGLPIFLIAMLTYINAPDQTGWPEISRHITILFVVMFQIFGAAYTFEGIEADFLGPMKDRLHATPANPMHLVVIQIAFSTLVSLIQSFILIVFSMVLFDAAFERLFAIMGFLVLSALAAQILGGVLVMLLKSASKAQVVITLYAIFAPMLAGLNFSLPDHAITPYLERYSSPIAWTRTGLEGILNGEGSDTLFGVLSLLALIAILTVLLRQVSKKVIA
ncbi:MAG: ABC transporter permease [Bacillota bacterium]